MRKWIKDNSLTLALICLFLVSLIGQAITGWHAELKDLTEHRAETIGFLEYLGGGQFLSALFENWESEFLQMWAYVMLTAYLFQRGSPESRDPDKVEVEDEEGEKAAQARGQRGRHGMPRKLYEHSLGMALLALFLASFVLHWVNSARHSAEDAVLHGEPVVTLAGRLADMEFWFESFQNWQSEFLSTALLVVLGIFLREKGSTESKAVDDPDSKTGA